MKTSAIIRIIVFSLTIVILLTVMIAGIAMNGVRFHFATFGIPGGTVASEGSVTADQIRELQIEWVSGSVTIQTGDTDTITFRETGASDEKDTMVWKQTGDKLQIQFQKPRVWFGFSFGTDADSSKDLVITVPDHWDAQGLQITSVSAEVSVEGITASSLDLENVSAHCRLTDCTVQELQIQTVSGAVDVTGAVNDICVETVSADCTLTLAYGTSELDVDSVSGDLILYFPSSQGFTAELDTVSGEITTAFSTTMENGTHTHKDGSCKIEASSVSGDIIIERNKAI